MNETLTILSQMGWPTSAALIGIAFSFAGGAAVAVIARSSRKKAEISARRDVQVTQAKGQVTQMPTVREPDY